MCRRTNRLLAGRQSVQSQHRKDAWNIGPCCPPRGEPDFALPRCPCRLLVHVDCTIPPPAPRLPHCLDAGLCVVRLRHLLWHECCVDCAAPKRPSVICLSPWDFLGEPRKGDLPAPFRICYPMKRRLAFRLKQAALKAARPARRGIVRALRHHAASAHRQQARAGIRPQTSAGPGGFVRAWLRTLISALWVRSAARPFSLRTLLRHRTRTSFAAARGNTAHRVANRRVRRLAASAGWFSFAP